ncbi:hypothetical protein ACH4ND_14025 [Streptomyces sp. NPDC017179]|uniref:hypothetical protein n=1 Tax=Streptomyces sp. NPDC017179 TaxID=3364979 RepID=UPI0037B94407
MRPAPDGRGPAVPGRERRALAVHHGAPVRMPRQAERDGKGCVRDRRWNANVDPYGLTRQLIATCRTAPDEAGRA